jgi:hypothetical protein
MTYYPIIYWISRSGWQKDNSLVTVCYYDDRPRHWEVGAGSLARVSPVVEVTSVNLLSTSTDCPCSEPKYLTVSIFGHSLIRKIPLQNVTRLPIGGSGPILKYNSI